MVSLWKNFFVFPFEFSIIIKKANWIELISSTSLELLNWIFIESPIDTINDKFKKQLSSELFSYITLSNESCDFKINFVGDCLK